MTDGEFSKPFEYRDNLINHNDTDADLYGLRIITAMPKVENEPVKVKNKVEKMKFIDILKTAEKFLKIPEGCLYVPVVELFKSQYSDTPHPFATANLLYKISDDEHSAIISLKGKMPVKVRLENRADHLKTGQKYDITLKFIQPKKIAVSKPIMPPSAVNRTIGMRQ